MKFYTNVSLSGNNIQIREVVNNKRNKRKIEYNPTLYVPSKKESKFRTLNGKNVEPIQLGSIKETREWVKEYGDVSGFEVFGQTSFQYAWIADEFPEETVEYDIQYLSIWSLDIECESERGFPKVETASEKVNAITMRDMTNKVSHVFGTGDFKTDDKSIIYIQCEDEEELLLKFVDFWSTIQPDIVTGWSIGFFDIPYLVNRITSVFDEDMAKKLSPWRQLRQITINFMNQDKPSYEIIGVAILDYFRLYKKYTFTPRENFQLGYIAQLELGKTKVSHDEFETMSQFYKKDYQKFIEYNIEDAILVEELEFKLRLIELTLTVAYQAHINYEDVISQVRTWDMIIYNYLKRDNIVIPQKIGMHKDQQYAGAYVKEPDPGMYKWIVSFDVTSLYPSIMMANNIGIETKRTDLFWLNHDVNKMLDNKQSYLDAFEIAKKNNATLAANGIYYDKEPISFYSRMIAKLFNDRMEYRKKAKECKVIGDKLGYSKFDIKQMATKIQLNSLYGACGSSFFRYFDIQNAEAVTLTGQFIIQYIEQGMNAYLNKVFKTENKNYVIYCDTDSIYVTLEEIVGRVFKDKSDLKKISAFLNKICQEKLEPELDNLFSQIDVLLNGISGHLKMKREVIANKVIWTGKKRYLMNVCDNEGELYEKPKLKVKGVEIIKSTVPKFCRIKMEEAVKIVVNDDDNDKLITFIEKCREEFYKLPANEVSFPRGVNGLEKYFNADKGTPLHVRAALVYNRMIDECNLTKKYQKIQEGEKIKYCYLIVPNPTKDKVIAFLSKLPPEMKLEKYIDYTIQFEKGFIEPLNNILSVIGWDYEKKSSLNKFF
jgi:DNA polymerase elongation subunit (family B)